MCGPIQDLSNILLDPLQLNCNATELKIDDIENLSHDIMKLMSTLENVNWNAFVMNMLESNLLLLGIDLSDPVKTIQLIRYTYLHAEF